MLFRSIVPIPPQVAKAISIGALRAAKAVIQAAKAANNFTKQTMTDAMAAAEAYVRNYMANAGSFKPEQIEEMVKRVATMMTPVKPATIVAETVAANSELADQITKASDKAFKKMAELIAKEGVAKARKQAIDLLRNTLAASKTKISPRVIDKI